MDAKRVVKSSFWYVVSKFATKGIGLFLTPLFARMMSQSDYGLFSNFSSWLNIFLIITTLNLGTTLISAKYDYEDRFDSYIFSITLLALLSIGFWTFLSNLLSQQLTNFTNISHIHINCIFIYTFGYAVIDIFQMRERYIYKYKASAIISILLSVVIGGLSVLFVCLMDSDTYSARIYGEVIPTIILGIILFVYIFKNGKSFDPKMWKYAIKICLPFIPHLLSLTFLNSVDQIMITSFQGEEYTALYALAYTCGSLMTLLASSLNMAFAPWIGDSLHEQKHSAIKKVSTIYILAFLSITIGVVLISPEILLILGGSKYANSRYVIPPIAMGCVCQLVYTMFASVEQFEKKTIGMALASVSAALLNFLLNLWLIPLYGYVAAAFTTFVGFVWLMLFHMFLVYKLKLSKCFNYKIILIVLVLLVVLSIALEFVFLNDRIRYFIVSLYIVAFVFLTIIFRKRISYILHLLLKR